MFSTSTQTTDDDPPAAVMRRKTTLLAGGDFRDRVRHIGFAGHRPLDRPIDPRFVRTGAVAGLAGRGSAQPSRLLSLIVIFAREMLALARSPRSKNCGKPQLAPRRDDAAAARKVVAELTALVPQSRNGGRPARLADLHGEIIDGANLVRLAETEILGAAGP